MIWDFLNEWECSSSVGLNDLEAENDREILKIVDFLGREVEFKANIPLFYIYSDGAFEKCVILD